MIVYMLYATVKLVFQYVIKPENDPLLAERAIDSADICLQISYLLMVYGIADSIRGSVERHQRDMRLKGEEFD